MTVLCFSFDLSDMHTCMSVYNFLNPQKGYNSWHVLMWHCSYENTTAVTKNCKEAIFVSGKIHIAWHYNIQPSLFRRTRIQCSEACLLQEVKENTIIKPTRKSCSIIITYMANYMSESPQWKEIKAKKHSSQHAMFCFTIHCKLQ